MVHICVGLMICLRRNGSKVVSVLTSELSGVLVDTHAVQQAFPRWQEWISNSKEDWGRKWGRDGHHPMKANPQKSKICNTSLPKTLKGHGKTFTSKILYAIFVYLDMSVIQPKLFVVKGLYHVSLQCLVVTMNCEQNHPTLVWKLTHKSF